MQRADFREAIRTLAMPALFLHGAADLRPAHFVQVLADSFPHSRFELVPQAGHFPWVEQPELVRAALRGFLTGLA